MCFIFGLFLGLVFGYVLYFLVSPNPSCSFSECARSLFTDSKLFLKGDSCTFLDGFFRLLLEPFILEHLIYAFVCGLTSFFIVFLLHWLILLCYENRFTIGWLLLLLILLWRFNRFRFLLFFRLRGDTEAKKLGKYTLLLLRYDRFLYLFLLVVVRFMRTFFIFLYIICVFLWLINIIYFSRLMLPV